MANRKRNKQYREDDRTLTEDILDFVKVFAISAIVILIFVNFIAHPVTVVGHSMDPNLADGEYGFTSVISPAISGVQRGDIVVLNMEEENGEMTRWVKRIIGLPGETIECRNGQVYVDGVVLDESAYLDEDFMKQSTAAQTGVNGVEYGNFTYDFDPVTLGDDEYFVMGDNRVVSKDSREIGPVTADKIFGKGILVLYPFNKIGVK